MASMDRHWHWKSNSNWTGTHICRRWPKTSWELSAASAARRTPERKPNWLEDILPFQNGFLFAHRICWYLLIFPSFALHTLAIRDFCRFSPPNFCVIILQFFKRAFQLFFQSRVDDIPSHQLIRIRSFSGVEHSQLCRFLENAWKVFSYFISRIQFAAEKKNL